MALWTAEHEKVLQDWKKEFDKQYHMKMMEAVQAFEQHIVKVYHQQMDAAAGNPQTSAATTTQASNVQPGSASSTSNTTGSDSTSDVPGVYACDHGHGFRLATPPQYGSLLPCGHIFLNASSGYFYAPDGQIAGGFFKTTYPKLEVQQNFPCPGCKTDLNESDKAHGTCWKCGRKL